MVPKKDKKKKILYCAKCGFSMPFKSGKVKERVIPIKKSVEVVVDTEQLSGEKEHEMKEAFLESYEINEEEDETDD
jgi:DNA-directed RNA polymerase subunit M/transcription elongation factor TFIIS